MTLAPPPPRVFLDSLAARKVPALAGQCVTELDASWVPAVLALIHDLIHEGTGQRTAIGSSRGTILGQAGSIL